MSLSLRKKAAAAVSAVGIAAASLMLAGGTASAATPACHSPLFTGCVKIVNTGVHANSWRITVRHSNGGTWNRCLIGGQVSKTSYWPGVWYSTSDKVLSMTPYGGNACQGNTRIDRWSGQWSGPHQDQYHQYVAYRR